VRAFAGAALLLAALALGGCGGDDDGGARAACEAEAKNAAYAAALAQAFEKGKLGTRAEVQSNFTPDDRLFDGQGRMIPYRELGPLTRARFEDWMNNDSDVNRVMHDAFQEESRKLEESGYPSC
jgi:hypothetical protein